MLGGRWKPGLREVLDNCRMTNLSNDLTPPYRVLQRESTQACLQWHHLNIFFTLKKLQHT